MDEEPSAAITSCVVDDSDTHLTCYMPDQENKIVLPIYLLPETYVERLQNIMLNGDDEQNIKLFDFIETDLLTKPHSFLLRFVQAGGINALLTIFSSMDYNTQSAAMHGSMIGCFRALMNDSYGTSHVLGHRSAISTIARSLIIENPRIKIAVLEILGTSCLIPGGHKKVLDAMTNYKEFTYERARFQGIINDLNINTGDYTDDLTVKTLIMAFINALLSHGPGEESLEFRLNLRNEFLQLGLMISIKKLREYENQTLDRHINLFDTAFNNDRKALARKIEQTNKEDNPQSATSTFDSIHIQLINSPAYPHFLSLFHNFLLLPLKYGNLWVLFDQVVQQLTLQTNAGADNYVSPIDMDVKQIIQLLAKEEELVATRNKVELLEKANSNITALHAEKTKELDLKYQEKEDSFSRLECLEKETKQKVSELEAITSALQHRITYGKEARRKLEEILNNGTLLDDTERYFNAHPMHIPPPLQFQ